MKLLIGGSPCTYWSIAQTKNRETEASGMGWELFRNYVLARDKLQPDYFLYGNNRSMSHKIREQITAMLGVEPVYINSALVSAQNRQRLYWCGKRKLDGTYEQVEIEQPEDKGIMLRDILESGVCWKEKSYALRASEGGRIADSHAVRTIETNGKEACDGVAEPVKILTEREIDYMVREAKDGRNHFDRGYYSDGSADKSKCLTANISRGVPYNVICEPVRIGTIENKAKNEEHDSRQYRVYSPDGKSVALCGNGGRMGAKTGLYAVPAKEIESNEIPALRVKEATKAGYIDIAPGECVDLAQENSKTRRGRRMAEKSNCLTTSCSFYEYCGTIDRPIYQVEDGKITIKGEKHPIKLRDGCYIIRKLTVTECKRLQTVPDSYEFPVSNSQAYKMLGNGWTVDVIVHLLSHFDGITSEPVDVLSMYDGMACGHIALDRLSANIRNYYATEIDKYAIKTATHNFPDIVELGDAFNIRWDSTPVEQKCLPEVVEKGA